MISNYRESLNQYFNVVGRKVAATGITPNQLTLLGLALSFLACLVLLITKNQILFFILILLFGMVDVLDGVVARLTQKTSKFGGYLDAMCDRYVEIASLFSMAVITGYWALSFWVICGSLLTSYAKARAAMEVSISNLEWPDFMERGERCIIFLLGVLASGLWQGQVFGHDLYYWALVILAAGTNYTALQRGLRAKKIIEERSR